MKWIVSVVSRRQLRILALSCMAVIPASAQMAIDGLHGASVQMASDGTYSITIPNPGWQLRGALGSRPSSLHVTKGSDGTGVFSELAFDYITGTSHRSASVRMWADRPVILFSVSYANAAPNAAPFPAFSSFPGGLLHLTYFGMFAEASFSAFAPDSPWVYFDPSGNTLIVSPASDYMAAEMRHGVNNQVESGISTAIASLPAGFTHKTLVAYGQGINATLSVWGQALTDLTGKTRPASDADSLLKSVSYWTDNGATYYYNPGPSSFPETLKAVRKEFDDKGIALGSLQLDSWWYPKGPDETWSAHGGMWNYSAAPGIFPAGLAALQTSLGVPLVTHARWLDVASPYRNRFTISGNVATDPGYWEEIATYLHGSGVTTYEQDWLGLNAQASFNLTDPVAFLSNMAISMAKRGISIQYCMAEPKHFLQSTNYSNVTSIRTSQDRFHSANWNNFLFTSRFASALGLWPFSDVFMSGERDNLLLATLSAGPVGVGDPLGSLNVLNLKGAVRDDGVIVKPDVPITPVDAVYIADALGSDTPMVATTYSDFGRFRATYILAYPRGANTQIAIRPADFGITGPAWLYDHLKETGVLIEANAAANVNLNGTGYFILVPTGKSGIAFPGDQDQFVTLGKERIPAVADEGRVEASVYFAPGETVRRMFGYSPHAVKASASGGRIEDLTWNASTELFSFKVYAPKGGMVRLRIAKTFSLLPMLAGQ